MSLEGKIKTLKKIFIQYSKLLPKKTYMKLKRNKDHLIIVRVVEKEDWINKSIKIPYTEIDSAIKQYRDLLRYKKQKLSENKNKTLDLNKK